MTNKDPVDVQRYRSTYEMDISRASSMATLREGMLDAAPCPWQYTITCRECRRSVDPLVTEDLLINIRWRPDWCIEASFMSAPCEHWEVIV